MIIPRSRVILEALNFCLNNGQRAISTSCLLQKGKIIPNNASGSSSYEWLKRQLNDPYVKKARYDNYRARSAYKLLEIDEKYQILKPGGIMIDCGAAPGAWTQVMIKKGYPGGNPANKNGTLIIGIDLSGISPIEGANLIPYTDFTNPMNQAKIIQLLRDCKVDVFCSDMAPKASGDQELDHPAIVKLFTSALQFSVQVLKPQSGSFLGKLWDGEKTQELKEIMSKLFTEVHLVKPPASRDESSEIFLLGLKFKGIKQ